MITTDTNRTALFLAEFDGEWGLGVGAGVGGWGVEPNERRK